MALPTWQRPRFNNAGGPIDEFTRGSAPPGQGSGAGDPAASLGWTLTRQVPEEAPPPGSTYFAQADTANIVGAATSTLFPGARFTIDPDRYGVLKSVDFEVTDYTKTSVVRFALLLNGTPARGFDAILIPPAAASLKTRGFDLSLALGKGTQIDIQATDVDGGAYTVNVAFFGWQWPASIDARYRPEGVGVR